MADFDIGGKVMCPTKGDVGLIFRVRAGDKPIHNIAGHVVKSDFSGPPLA